jgi:hypothetical protein
MPRKMFLEDCKIFFIFSKNLIVKLKEGAKEVKSNTPLKVGILTSTVARMNTMLISVIFIINNFRCF